MRNNSAVSIQKLFPSFSSGRYCVRIGCSVSLGRRVGRALSRSKPRPPASLSVPTRRCSVRCAVNSRALSNNSHTTKTRWECDLRGRLKSRYNRSYICICEENFLYSHSSGTGRVCFVGEAWPAENVLLYASDCTIGASIVVLTTDFPIGAAI